MEKPARTNDLTQSLDQVLAAVRALRDSVDDDTYSTRKLILLLALQVEQLTEAVQSLAQARPLTDGTVQPRT